MTEVLRGFLQIVAGMAALFVLVGAAKWLEDDPTIVMTATDRAVFFVSLTGLVSACAGLRLDSLHRTVPREDAQPILTAIRAALTSSCLQRRVRRRTGDAELQRAWAGFDRVGPDAEAIRDLVVHLDEYATETGLRQSPGASSPIADPQVETFIHWSNGGGTILDPAGDRIKLRAAAGAAINLAEVVERVRGDGTRRAGGQRRTQAQVRDGLTASGDYEPWQSPNHGQHPLFIIDHSTPAATDHERR